MHARDPNLSEPPLKKVSSPAVLQSTPRSVVAFQELSNKQVSTYAKLAELGEQKYNLPDAAAALKHLIVDSRYEVAPRTFLEQPSRQFVVEEEGHANAEKGVTGT